MLEESQDLAERYPQKDPNDRAYDAGRIALTLVPWGATATELLSQVVAPPLMRRRDEWFQELAVVVDEIRKKTKNFNFETLQKNEQFVSAVLEASRIAVGTHQHEKRRFLRNMLVRIGSVCDVPEDLQFMYLRMVDDFTATHVRLLNFLWRVNERVAKANGGSLPQGKRFSEILEQYYPEFRGHTDIADQILADLRGRGLCTLQSIAHTYPQNVVPNSGIAFLMFVLSPEELP